MKKKQKVNKGKEQAKINKRKSFYSKLIRRIDDSDQVILITMNKGVTFPEYDDLSKLFMDDSSLYEAELNLDEVKSMDIVYMEEAYFILAAAKSEYLNIIRKVTLVDNQGNDRRGLSESDDYNYQDAFNWGFQIKNLKKMKSLLEKEKEEPSEHDMTQEKPVVQEPIYRKSHKFRRNRRR